MFPDTLRKRTQRDILDAQIFVKRDVDIYCLSVLMFFIVVTIGGLAYVNINFSPSSASSPVARDQTRQSFLNEMQDLEKLKIIAEDRENMCVAWRDVEGCVLDGVRRPRHDKDCSAVILPSETGWCDCKDGAGTHFHVDFDCAVEGRTERKESITCARTCMSRIQDGRDKSRKLSRAYEASAKRAEILVEAEKRRKEEAERKRREDEEREAAAQPIRALIREGDDMVGEIFSMIESKQLKAAEALLEKARNVYELAGAVVTAPENDSRWELRDLHKKPYASPQEMALSGVAEKLYQAMQNEEEQARQWREAMEAERLRQEAAIREAAAEVERRQLLELEELRRQQEERLRDLARVAQEEALELIRSKQRLEEEDRIRRSMTAEELRLREMRHVSIDEEEDPEAREARRRYAEFLERKRAHSEGSSSSGPPSLESGQEVAQSEARIQVTESGAHSVAVGLNPPSAFHEPAIQHERSGPRRVLTQALDPEPQLGGAPALQPGSLPEEEFLLPSTALRRQAWDTNSDADATAETDNIPQEVFLQPSAATTESNSDADSAAEADDATAAVEAEDAAGVDSQLWKALKAAGLSDHVAVLREVGVESLADIRYLDEAIIKLLPLEVEYKRSLRNFVLSHTAM